MPSYYVDATGGNDGDDGLSPGAAWQTIAKVNGEAFVAGDSVLFKRGETWVGTLLLFPSSGVMGNPITLADYDTGALPIIDGNDAVNCISVGGSDYIILQNLEVTQGLDFGIAANGASYIDIVDCVAHDCGNDNIILINLTHHCTIIDCISFDAYERVVGPRITCLEITDEAHDIEIRNCEFYGSEGAGISIHSHAATEFPYNIDIRNCSSHDNDEYGLFVNQANAGAALPADAQIHITQCVFLDNSSVLGGGIWIGESGNPYPTGIEFDMCVSISPNRRPLFVGGRSTYRRCIFRANFQARVSGAQSAVFQNCLFYRVSPEAFDTANNPDGLTMRNCIIMTEGTTIIDIAAGATNVDLDYNLYWSVGANPLAATVFNWLGVAHTWANWLINSGQDANSPVPADPLFLDAANNNYYLDHGSPALQVGTPLAGAPFYGAAPDCGRWEMRWKSQRTEQLLEPAWKFA